MSRNNSWSPIYSPGIPIAFTVPGMKTDVRIRVFEKEFHVHSVLLKLYSAFFRTLLESADKRLEEDHEKRCWRYDYVSVREPDGGWGLEVAPQEIPSPSPSPSPATSRSPPDGMGSSADDVAFEKLLCAIYRREYTIAGLGELSDMTRLAEWYGCLPTFSASLYTALWHSGQLVAEIPSNCNSALLLAQKLRHPLLFREALVHVVGQWEGYSSRFLDGHYSLVCAATLAYTRVCERLLATNQELFLAINRDGQVRQELCAATSDIQREQLPTQNAHFYRHLHDQWEGRPGDGLASVMPSLQSLLENKLMLERGRVRAGEADYQHRFLCAAIDDCELPWDPEEEDW
ncbi:unnamed protein product [Diplocarpon coronariae]